jgi:hypothetical protein
VPTVGVEKEASRTAEAHTEYLDVIQVKAGIEDV